MINSIYLTFCKIRFQLSRLWMPIEPIVYDTRFKPGEETDEYQRFIVTRERRSYRLWYISFRVLEPLSIEWLSLFDSKLAAILAARSSDPYGVRAVKDLLSRKLVPPVSDELALESKASVIAMADGLDEFVELERCWPGYLKYTTKHGERCLSVDDPSKCQFEVTQTSDNFAEAVLLPYTTVPDIVSDYQNDYPEGTLVVYTTEGGEEVTSAGYAVAELLPYFVVSDSDEYALSYYFTKFELDDYPLGALIVDVNPWQEEALAAGYHNAVPLKCPSREDLYIEDLGMLDTEYAAILAQQSAEEDLVGS